MFMPKCPVCGGTEFEETDPITIKLPCGGSIGKIIGESYKTPTATVNLPFLTCKGCRTVLNPKKKES